MDGMLIIKIYGSDSNIRVNGRTVKYPLESAVSALSDVSTFELDVTGLFACLDTKSDKKEFPNGLELYINTIRNAFKPQGMPKSFPIVNTSIEDYFGSNTLSKKYKWLQISDYTLRPSELNSDCVIAINITDIRCSDNGNGTKTIGFDLVERG